MKKVLVTGASGFIGSHLCERLLEQGYEVTGIDNMDEPNSWIKAKNLACVLTYPNFTFIKADLINADLPALIRGFDTVCHLAATPGVRTSWGRSFASYLNNNILATQLLLEAAKKNPPQKIILASTSSVYGEVIGPAAEELCPRPLSPYGVTKLAAEQLGAVYHREFSLPLTILRFFTVYGPRQRPDMAFHRFIKSLLERNEIKVYGDGNQKRDFTYITDIINGSINAMHLPDNGAVFNLGGNTIASLNEVIMMLENITGLTARVSYGKPRPGEPKETWADISRAARFLNYSPVTGLVQGLTEEVNYIKDLYRL